MGPESNEELVLQKLDELLTTLRELKPNDRSNQDRYWAITITEVEKAFAVFVTFAGQPEGLAE